MSTILDEIFAYKKQQVATSQERVALADLETLAAAAPAPRGFAKAMLERAQVGPAIIAEIKRGSPSLGCIRPDLDAVQQAKAYEAGGAAALSVLTDTHFFFARPDDFSEIRHKVSLPMLRKDFMLDPYQLVESRAMGADCILLILAMLSNREAAALATQAHKLGMDVLAETHTTEEIQRAMDHVPFDLLGVNNRNLKTFTTREETTLELAAGLADTSRLVAESGLHTPDSIVRLWRGGITHFLIGEAFVKSADPRDTVAQFANAPSSPSTSGERS